MAAGAIQAAVSDSFGGFGRFEELFRATGMSLAGGSGWTILDYAFATGDLRIYWSGNHTQSVAFGAAAAQYLDVFVANVQWDEVSRRYEHARKPAHALKG